MPRVSVLMPTFRQAAFVRRAIESLVAQSLRGWELIVVDDASPDETADLVRPFLVADRFRYLRLDAATADLIAYLPFDDVVYADHLASLVTALDAEPTAALAYAGVRHRYNHFAPGQIDGVALINRLRPASRPFARQRAGS